LHVIFQQYFIKLTFFVTLCIIQGDPHRPTQLHLTPPTVTSGKNRPIGRAAVIHERSPGPVYCLDSIVLVGLNSFRRERGI